jgi:hypothetical protein
MVLGREGMTVPMPNGSGYREVRDGGVVAFGDRRTARDLAQYGRDSHADMEDFSPRPGTRPGERGSRVEPFSRVVDSWLRADPVDAAQTAAYRAARVRPSGRGAGGRGFVFVGAAPDEAVAGDGPGRVGRVRGTGLGAGMRAGRFRVGEGRDRGRGARRAYALG